MRTIDLKALLDASVGAEPALLQIQGGKTKVYLGAAVKKEVEDAAEKLVEKTTELMRSISSSRDKAAMRAQVIRAFHEHIKERTDYLINLQAHAEGGAFNATALNDKDIPF